MPTSEALPRVLVLTPMKNAAPFLQRYADLLDKLDWPRECLSIGILEGDSRDDTVERLTTIRSRLEGRASRLTILSRDCGVQMPEGVPRWAPGFQLLRRKTLARARNQLLFRALCDEDWVLWVDVDLVEYPPDALHRLVASGHDLVMPRCAREPGGPAFDLNAWGDKGRISFDSMGGQRQIRLDSMGGTMLLVKADLHRDGLVFPPFPYGVHNPRIRDRHPVWYAGEVETEGLGIMATDMGVQGWGLCDLEILHAAE